MLQLRTLYIISFLLIACSVIGKQQDKDSLLHALHTTVLPSDKIEILNLLAEEYSTRDQAQSENYANQALFLAQSINDELGESVARYHLALIERNKDNYEEAFQLLKIAKLGLLKFSETEWMGKVDMQLAIEYKRRLEFEQALVLLFDALDVFSSLENEEKKAEINNQIGGVYFDQGNYEKAFQYYQISYSIYSEINMDKGIGSLLVNLGEIYRLTGRPAEAMDFYERALIIHQKYNRERPIAITYNNIGSIYLDDKKIDSAKKYFNQSLIIGEKLNDPDLISSASNSLGNLYLQSVKNDTALLYFKQGFETAAALSNILNLKDASKGLSDFYAAKGDFKLAYQYHDQFKNLNDSIKSLQNQEKITRLEMQNIYDHEQKIMQVRKQKKQFRYFLIAAFLLIALIILVLVYGRQKIKIKHSHWDAQNLKLEKDRLKEEIEFKNRELTTNVIYMVRTNELINFISQKLIKAREKIDTKYRSEIQELIIGLQFNIDKDVWQEFEVRFREVHKNFYEKLMELHPNLSDNEKRMCAFLKLNMTTKEIAAITHQNLNSIEVARTRMRKKMNLNNTDINLNNYLAGL